MTEHLLHSSKVLHKSKPNCPQALTGVGHKLTLLDEVLLTADCFWERERYSIFFKGVTTDESTRFQWIIPSNWTLQLYICLYMHMCAHVWGSQRVTTDAIIEQVKVTVVTDSLLAFGSLPSCVDSFTYFLWSHFQETHYHPSYLFRFCIHDFQTWIFAGKIICSTEQDKSI